MKPLKTKIYKKPKSYPENWSSLRLKVLSRDGYRCTRCKRDKKALEEMSKIKGYKVFLHVHHKVSVRLGNNKLSNLITLCSLCHAMQPGHSHLRR